MVELLQTLCVFYLCGLIWMIQLVHYPSFSYVDSREFSRFHRQHTVRISTIVIPAMLGELVAGFYLLFRVPSYGTILHLLLFCILGIIWLSTFLIQVPIHTQLRKGKDPQKIEVLVKTNWIRTFGWTMRAMLLSVSYLGSVSVWRH